MSHLCQATYLWRDVAGKETSQWHTTQDNPAPPVPSAVALANALSLASDAKLYRVHVVAVSNNYGPGPVSGPYGTVDDRLRFLFEATGAGRAIVDVVAPKAQLFLAGGRTVDRDNTIVQGVIGAALADLADANGIPVDRLVSAFRLRH